MSKIKALLATDFISGPFFILVNPLQVFRKKCNSDAENYNQHDKGAAHAFRY